MNIESSPSKETFWFPILINGGEMKLFEFSCNFDNCISSMNLDIESNAQHIR